MSSDLYSEQTSSSTESSSLSGQSLNDYLPLPSGNGTKYESEDFLPSRSTLEPSSGEYYGAVCHGTVSVVPCRRGNHIEMMTQVESIIDGTDRQDIKHGREWESDMDQAHIQFTSHYTLNIIIKSDTFPTPAAFTTFAKLLICNPCCPITLDISEGHCPGFPSSDTTRGTSVAEWGNVILRVMDLGELGTDGACVMRCEFMGGDVTRTLNLYLCPDRDLTSAISVIRSLVALNATITLGSMDIGASLTTIQPILPMFFEDGSSRGLKLCRPPPNSFRSLSIWCGRHLKALVVEVTENGTTALLDWLCQILEDQPSRAPPKLTLRFSSRAAQKVQPQHWKELDRLLLQRNREELKLESLDEGIQELEDMLENNLPRLLAERRSAPKLSFSPFKSTSRKVGSFQQRLNNELSTVDR